MEGTDVNQNIVCGVFRRAATDVRHCSARVTRNAGRSRAGSRRRLGSRQLRRIPRLRFLRGALGPEVHPHIRHYTPPRDEQLEKEAAARERKWVARCRPVLWEDSYGVSRYQYAIPGCEFGKSQD